MSQTPPDQDKPDETPADGNTGFPEHVTEDIGGVQGEAPDEDDEASGARAAAHPGAPADAPAPDAGEIEWAGQLVKKPPTPSS
jgi:hypothetical protein